jgi:uncharacterized protein YndB with AHSA1/START domain
MNVLGASGSPGVTVDRDSCTIRFERRFDAARSQVFEAWTTPEQVASWWDPAGDPLAACEIQLRVGGSFFFVSRGHPEMPFSGVYREIVPPERLVFEAMGATGRVMLEDAGGGTRMVVEIVCASTDHLDQFVKMGVHAGTSRTLDNLVVFVRDSEVSARRA